MSYNFDSHKQKAQEFVNQVAFAIGTPDDKEHAWRITKAFFGALRERISPEESLHLISHFPLLLKGAYVDGWKLSKWSVGTDTLHEFLDDIRMQCGEPAARDLGNDTQATRIIRSLISAIRSYTDQGELDDISAQLPESIAALFERVEV